MILSAVLQHFGLRSDPFARAVPPDALLRHKSFAESLSRLLLAIDSRSGGLLIAEPGLGKSTLIATLADSLDPSRIRLVYTPLCACGPYGLIGQLATRYGMRPKRSAAQTAQAIGDELARSGKAEVLVLDEAHRLPFESLDELRMLANSDFDRTPTFTIILVGQTKLRERIADADLASLWQRIPVRTTLAALSDRETIDYVDRRMHAAGAVKSPFRPGALDKLFEKSRGVPRIINTIGTHSLLAAATASRKHVDVADVETASFDLDNA